MPKANQCAHISSVTVQTKTDFVLDWLRHWYMRQTEYTAELRGFPELDMADIITLDDGSTAQITASELTYNGAFRQKLTYRK